MLPITGRPSVGVDSLAQWHSMKTRRRITPGTRRPFLHNSPSFPAAANERQRSSGTADTHRWSNLRVCFARTAKGGGGTEAARAWKVVERGLWGIFPPRKTFCPPTVALPPVCTWQTFHPNHLSNRRQRFLQHPFSLPSPQLRSWGQADRVPVGVHLGVVATAAWQTDRAPSLKKRTRRGIQRLATSLSSKCWREGEWGLHRMFRA